MMNITDHKGNSLFENYYKNMLYKRIIKMEELQK